MSLLKNRTNKSASHKLKRALAFKGWRRNISAKEKLFAQQKKTSTDGAEGN